jgi:hypothetical protein
VVGRVRRTASLGRTAGRRGSEYRTGTVGRTQMRRRAASAPKAEQETAYGSTRPARSPRHCRCRECTRCQGRARCRWVIMVLALLYAGLRAAELAGGYGSLGSVLAYPVLLSAWFAKESLLEVLLDLQDQIPFGLGATNAYGMDAMHIAALRGSDWAAAILVRRGYDPGRIDGANATALQLARSAYGAELVRSGPRRVAAYLINWGACAREPW